MPGVFLCRATQLGTCEACLDSRMPLYRVLVIGGYGFFGRRLVERLARSPGLHLIVAGRSAAQGLALADALRGAARAQLSCATLDADAPAFADDLKALAPDITVHTSGPFQGQRYHVAQACMAAGAHYIDLADGRDFVVGISSLNQAALDRGLSIISGASSVPALSDAAARHLAQGLTRVDHIDIGISPGNRTERGLATVRAILSYCGKALPAVDHRPSFGWSGSRRHLYPVPVGNRLLSPCDVPDLALLPKRHAGCPTISFGAGLELPLLHRGMNALALLARVGIVKDWSAHAVALKWLGDRFSGLGSNAGAMHVCVSGETAEGISRSRTWHLVATHGDGPFVPTLAAAALIRKLQHGDASLAGAQPCVGLLSLQDFARESEGLHIDMNESSSIDALSLYERVLGASYSQLPMAVQRFHRLAGHTVLNGWVQTQAPSSLPARLLAFCLGTPRRASSGPLSFELDASAEAERWTRHFPTRTMTSRMRLVAGKIQEKLGAARLTFGLSVADGRLRMELEGLRFMGLPCPRWLMPQVVAEETGKDDQLHFRVAAGLPLLGTVAAYDGHLELGPAQATS